MTIDLKNIIPPKFAENTQTTQYTASLGKTVIDKMVAINTGSVNVAFSVNLVDASGSAADSNLVIDAKTIAPNESYECPEVVGQLLENSAFISTLASAAGALTIRATGREIT